MSRGEVDRRPFDENVDELYNGKPRIPLKMIERPA
jgi:hypothetical protein